jgi:hypothetical protein
VARSGTASIQARPISPKSLRCQEANAFGTSIRGPAGLVTVLRLAQSGAPERRSGVTPFTVVACSGATAAERHLGGMCESGLSDSGGPPVFVRTSVHDRRAAWPKLFR